MPMDLDVCSADAPTDGEAGATVADRSTAAVGVANDGGATLDGAADTATSSEAAHDTELDQDGPGAGTETPGPDDVKTEIAALPPVADPP